MFVFVCVCFFFRRTTFDVPFDYHTSQSSLPHLTVRASLSLSFPLSLSPRPYVSQVSPVPSLPVSPFDRPLPPLRSESSDFLLLARRDAILRLPLESVEGGAAPLPLPLAGIANVVAVEYDKRSGCLYWSDTASKHVMVRVWPDAAAGHCCHG